MAKETIEWIGPNGLNVGAYEAYYRERDQAKKETETETKAVNGQDEAQASEERRKQAMEQVEAPYLALAQNAGEAKNEDLAKVLATLAELAGSEAEQILSQPEEVTAKQRNNERQALVPDRPQGSLIDLGKELPDGTSHIVDAAVGVARVLLTEGTDDIALNKFDFTNEQESNDEATQVFPQPSPGVQTQYNDVLTMLGATDKTQINDQSAGNTPILDIFHYKTNFGFTVKETVRYPQKQAKGRSDGATLVDRSRPVSLTLSIVRTPAAASSSQMPSVPASTHPAVARRAA